MLFTKYNCLIHSVYKFYAIFITLLPTKDRFDFNSVYSMCNCFVTFNVYAMSFDLFVILLFSVINCNLKTKYG